VQPQHAIATGEDRMLPNGATRSAAFSADGVTQKPMRFSNQELRHIKR
jgi:hypothetical protein